MKSYVHKFNEFFISLSQDPTFISFDTAFINNESEENYNNLVNYVKLRNEQFIETLNLNENFLVVTTMMSDDRIPMYNSDSDKNTYMNYINGNIKFNTKDEYVGGIKSLFEGSYLKYYPFKGFLISHKVGLSLQEQLIAGGLSVAGLGIILILAGLWFARPIVIYIGFVFLFIGLVIAVFQ
jgi:hypothetical protein